uniref:Fructose-6-phosphate-2-kinase/fructose-2, 6-bisphosphatase n=1 Tax=Arundo donax TaxID=35708 RepID=A0A0A9I3K7_ARUDO
MSHPLIRLRFMFPVFLQDGSAASLELDFHLRLVWNLT